MEKSLDHMPHNLWFMLTNPKIFAAIPTLSKILLFCVNHLNKIALRMHS